MDAVLLCVFARTHPVVMKNIDFLKPILDLERGINYAFAYLQFNLKESPHCKTKQ